MKIYIQLTNGDVHTRMLDQIEEFLQELDEVNMLLQECEEPTVGIEAVSTVEI